ncbi:MAG: YncE family protein, partial [Candidatus Wallbacteria bacterium]|nr:YncE family protein [Candidatus Wallbacteria bacterium]
FSISNIPVGTYQLMASYPDYTGYSGMVGINQSWNMITINLAPGLDHIAFDQASYDLLVGETLDLNRLITAYYLDGSSGMPLFGLKQFQITGTASLNFGNLSSFTVEVNNVQCQYTENGIQEIASVPVAFDYLTLIYNSSAGYVYRIGELSNDSLQKVDVVDNPYSHPLRYLPWAAEYFVANGGYLEKRDRVTDALQRSTMLNNYSDTAVSPTADRVYVASYGYGFYAYDYNTLAEVGQAYFVGEEYNGLAVTSDGNHVYGSVMGQNYLQVVNAVTLTEECTIEVGSYSLGLIRVFDTVTGDKAFVVDGSLYNVFVIDVATQTWEDTIEAGSYPYDIIASPDGNYVYMLLSNMYSNLLVKYEAGNYTTPLASFLLATNNADELRITADGLYLYVSCDQSVFVIDTDLFDVVYELDVSTGQQVP